MYHVQVAALVLLALILCWATTPPDPCQLGWFGSRCQFKCRCQSNACDSEGQCLGVSKCQGGWFGPACQYADLAYKKTPQNLITDGDDDTCINDNDTNEVTIDLGGMYPITWVRILVSEPGYLTRLRFRLRQGDNFIKCPSLLVYSPNDAMKDLLCLFNETVSAVLIGGTGMHYLCSLYISGGRNIALKQKAEMFGFYQELSEATGFINMSFTADLAVDGNTSQDFYKGRSCAGTSYGYKPYWSLKFHWPVLVNRFVIYNRDVAMYRLADFNLVCYDEDGKTVFNYTDQTQDEVLVYTITRAYSAIQSVTLYASDIIKWMVVCEFEVYGDFDCDSRTFGLACDKECNCYFQEDCFISTGGCRNGCSAGFIGEDCLTPCPPGQYGFACQSECSQFCANDSLADSTCDHVSGKCLGGCQLGYMPPTCASVCTTGKYGPNCTLSCSPACRRPNEQDTSFCNRFNGTCMFGCDSGYYGPTCSVWMDSSFEEACPHNQYGTDCQQFCHRGCVLSNDSTDSACHHITGVCLHGCYDGYNGSLCKDSLQEPHTTQQSKLTFFKELVLIGLLSIFAALIASAALLFCLQKKSRPDEANESDSQDPQAPSPSGLEADASSSVDVE